MRYEILKYSRIKEMRNSLKYSQKEVAKILKIAQNTLSQYETGERNISNDILAQIAVLYETSTDYLLGLTDEKKPYKRSGNITNIKC